MVYSTTSLQSKLKRENDVREKVYLQILLAKKIFPTNISESIKLCQSSITIAKKLKIPHVLGGVYLATGQMYRVKGDYSTAKIFLKKAENIFRSLNEFDGLIYVEYELAAILLLNGEVKKSLIKLHSILIQNTFLEQSYNRVGTETTHYFRSQYDILLEKKMHTTDKHNIFSILYKIYSSISSAYYELGHNNNALRYAQQSLRVLRLTQEKAAYSTTLGNIGGIYMQSTNYNKAFFYNKSALSSAKKESNSIEIARAYFNMAYIFFRKGSREIAKKYAKSAYDLYKEIGLTSTSCMVLILLAEQERLHGKVRKAKEYMSIATKEIQNISDDVTRMKIIFESCMIELETSDLLSTYHKLHLLFIDASKLDITLKIDIADELLSVAKRLANQKFIEKWQRRIQQFENKKMASAIDKRIELLEVSHSVKILELEKKLLAIKESSLKKELETKNSELAILAKELSKKSSTLSSLVKYVEKLKDKDIKDSHKLLGMVNTHIGSVINQDKDFETLYSKANDLHKDFIIKLQKKQFKLSATEKKVCILLRLGLNTNEVANILFTSIRTVETHCLSIRKKFKINGPIRLSKYIQSM